MHFFLDLGINTFQIILVKVELRLSYLYMPNESFKT